MFFLLLVGWLYSTILNNALNQLAIFATKQNSGLRASGRSNVLLYMRCVCLLYFTIFIEQYSYHSTAINLLLCVIVYYGVGPQHHHCAPRAGLVLFRRFESRAGLEFPFAYKQQQSYLSGCCSGLLLLEENHITITMISELF